MNQINENTILLTGATGYVGGHLLQLLPERGYNVRCLARRPEYLASRVTPGVEVVQGNVMDKASLLDALRGVDAAYYLVHAMGSSHSFEDLEREGARNFGEAAGECKVKRIVYLGGLGDASADLSPHLRSRQEVGRVLRMHAAEVIELRASIVIGAGSLSFEMIRGLVERLPVMITPRWVSVEAQPIAISDLLAYLVQSMELRQEGHRIFEIGGADQMSYGALMREYAAQRNLRRLMIPVPVLTPRLSSLWLGLVTPLYARVGRKLIDSMRHPTVVQNRTAEQAFNIAPKSVASAIAEALRREDQDLAKSRWSDALSAAGPERNWGGVRLGNRLVDSRQATVNVPPAIAFQPIRRIGGARGWYYGNWLWHLRGFIDLLLGGVGIRRGRPQPDDIQVGDAIDWWRVVGFEPNRTLRLEAEMRVPGRAWLHFEVTGDDSQSTIRQTASFDPEGLSGLLYWYGIYPLHSVVFSGMLRGIIRECQSYWQEDGSKT